jgi:high-affinity iron transporter
MRRSWLLVLVALVLAVPASAAAAPPWQAAEQLRRDAFAAQTELILGKPAQAAAKARRATGAYRGELQSGLRAGAPAEDAAVRTALREIVRAARAGDEPALAAARGRVRAAVLRGATAVTLDALARGDAQTARSWLLLRDFRTATRFTRPDANATVAVKDLAASKLSAADAREAVAKDLLDAYQSRQRELLADADAALAKGFAARHAETAAQAAGYWPILAARFEQDRGRAAADAVGRQFAALAGAAADGDPAAYRAARARVAEALEGFTAAPFTAAESARRAQQLLRFLALVPVEYDRGVSGTNVTLDFEIQEAVAFRDGAAAAFTDLEEQLATRDRSRTDAVRADLARLGEIVEQASEEPKGVVEAGEVTALTRRAESGLAATMPKSWQESTDESDYDLIALTLDRMEAAVSAGQYHQAEQARLEAYAFFEFGPERRLKSFDPGLALDVEGLIWFGAMDEKGLAELIAGRAQRREIHQTRLVLDKRLADAAATLGDSANTTTVVTNSAIIVFREGLEAVLILAAITASFAGARRRLRRPVLLGAAGGLVVSLVTWVLAQTLLRSLEQYGEKLEAVVGLIAIGVLLLITNWFFHKVYWSEWIGKFHRRRRTLMAQEKAGFFSAQFVGLAVLGLTSVYREGFETVLFLQSLQLSAGTATVLEGAGLGLALTLGVAVVTFALQRKLPYKKMLIVTGVMIGFVLVVMVGQTTRTMQGTGWLPITPLDIELPYWLGLWFGVYPTWETVGAQFAAMAFVIGSYFLAQEVRVKRPRRRAAGVGGRDSSLEQDRGPDRDPRVEVDDVRHEHADAAV